MPRASRVAESRCSVNRSTSHQTSKRGGDANGIDSICLPLLPLCVDHLMTRVIDAEGFSQNKNKKKASDRSLVNSQLESET